MLNMTDFQVKEITKFNDFLSLKNMWNALLGKTDIETIFLRHEWFEAWLKGFGKEKELFILLLFDQTRLIGIAPLIIMKDKFHSLPVRCVRFIENDNTPRSDFILVEKHNDAIECFITYILKKRNLWDIVLLRNIPKENRSYNFIREVLYKRNIKHFVLDGLHSPYLKLSSDWESFLSMKSKRVRGAINNNINRVKRLGDISYAEQTDITNNAELIGKVFEVGHASWKEKIGDAISSSQENREFFKELSIVASQNKWLSIWLLNANGETIAFEYHLKYKNKRHGLRSEFKEQYNKFSPGSALDAFIIENLFNNRCEEYDMGGSANSYKMKWTSDIREHINIYIFNQKIYSIFLYFLEVNLVNTCRKVKDKLKEIKYKISDK